MLESPLSRGQFSLFSLWYIVQEPHQGYGDIGRGCAWNNPEERHAVTVQGTIRKFRGLRDFSWHGWQDLKRWTYSSGDFL